MHYLLLALFMFQMLAGCNSQDVAVPNKYIITERDLSAFSNKAPEKKINLLFIHHSCGATLMAEPGEKKGEYCLYVSHPNGGGLRNLLIQNNYSVHEATYGSKIGQDTDICHWNGKFRNDMDIILKTDHQDKLYSDGSVNNIVMFKSCYPASEIIADGIPPADPDSCEKTVANYKAAYNSLLPYFRQHPGTLFIAITAPPIVKPRMNPVKEFLKNISGTGPEAMGKRTRHFNNWLKDVASGWLKDYELKNVVVFDYYDILTGKGESNWAKFPTRDGKDSHPSSQGNLMAAQEFINLLNLAVHYGGLS
jgi:hypothetical protein